MKAAKAEPEIVTRNGKPVSIILTIEAYEELLARAEAAESRTIGPSKVTENNESNLKKQLDDDHKAVAQLRKEFEEAKIEFDDFRAASQTDMNLLMWLTDMVRTASLHAMEGRPDEAALCSTKARLQVEDLKNRLRP